MASVYDVSCSSKNNLSFRLNTDFAFGPPRISTAEFKIYGRILAIMVKLKYFFPVLVKCVIIFNEILLSVTNWALIFLTSFHIQILLLLKYRDVILVQSLRRLLD